MEILCFYNFFLHQEEIEFEDGIRNEGKKNFFHQEKTKEKKNIQVASRIELIKSPLLRPLIRSFGSRVAA